MTNKSPDGVDAFVGSLDHPPSDAFRAVCASGLAGDPSISDASRGSSMSPSVANVCTR